MVQKQDKKRKNYNYQTLKSRVKGWKKIELNEKNL